MATTTYNYTLNPASGWVQIAGPSAFLRVSSDPDTRSFYLYIGDTIPTSTNTAIGIEISHGHYDSNVAFTGNAYARVTDGSVRLDVESIPASAASSGNAVGIADGADTAEGATTSPAYTDSTGASAGTVVGLLKGAYVALKGLLNVTTRGGANIATGQVAVTTSSTLVAAARTNRQKITLQAASSVVYYVGVSGVSSTTGVYIPAGGSITIETSAAVYAVGASAVTISYIELY